MRSEFLVAVTMTAVTWDIILSTLSEECASFQRVAPCVSLWKQNKPMDSVGLVDQGSGICIRSKTTKKDYRGLIVVIELLSV
jgi:hypothetical protein